VALQEPSTIAVHPPPSFPPTESHYRLLQAPTVTPSIRPTAAPTVGPSRTPSGVPTTRPTMTPSERPSKRPTAPPTRFPSRHPTVSPTRRPSVTPTELPTRRPSKVRARVQGGPWAGLDFVACGHVQPPIYQHLVHPHLLLQTQAIAPLAGAVGAAFNVPNPGTYATTNGRADGAPDHGPEVSSVSVVEEPWARPLTLAWFCSSTQRSADNFSQHCPLKTSHRRPDPGMCRMSSSP
jgi:hypothetical protein